MGQRLIITEEEKNIILSLYEQTDKQYKKENDFLKRYVGKTFNIYTDSDFQTLASNSPQKIESIIYYENGLSVKGKYYLDVFEKDDEFDYFFRCLHNPNRLGYSIDDNILNRTWQNKTLIDNINQQGAALGIKWCQKPKADFGIKQSKPNTDKMV